MLIGFECQKNYAILHRQLAVTSDFSALRAEAILYLGPVVTSKKNRRFAQGHSVSMSSW